MDITPYHWIFAGLFMVAFVAVMFYTYRKDRKVNRKQFGNTMWVAYLIGGGIILLIIIKFALRNLSD
ncbi:MAG: hypothetical protein KDC13_03345 [Bacteroidetes bacterium]|nr:hypothetical protein [Bacteroidota bacterium]